MLRPLTPAEVLSPLEAGQSAVPVTLVARLRHPDAVGVFRHYGADLGARLDVELREHLAEVIRDCVPADEQPFSDLCVREPFAREPRDLSFLRGEVIAGLDAARADMLARGQQLALGPLGERLGPHRVEHLKCGAQLLASVEAAPLPPQPFAVEEMGAGELHADARASEPLNRLAIQAVGLVAVGEQRAAAGLDPEAPISGAGAGSLGDPLERS